MNKSENVDLVLSMAVHEGLHVLSDQFRPVAVLAVIEAGGDHVVVGEFSFGAAEARALSASIVAAADLVETGEVLG